MSNFKCSECGMINIDCGLGVFKTPREIELEKENEILKEKLKIAEEALQKMHKPSLYDILFSSKNYTPTKDERG